MAEDGGMHGAAAASTVEHLHAAPVVVSDPNPIHSRKSTLEASMFDVHVTGTTTPTSGAGYGQQKAGSRHMMELDEYFVSLHLTLLSKKKG